MKKTYKNVKISVVRYLDFITTSNETKAGELEIKKTDDWLE